LSPISLSGRWLGKHPARTATTSRHSAGEALSKDTPRGRLLPAVIATISVPLPGLAGPTKKPPFLALAKVASTTPRRTQDRLRHFPRRVSQFPTGPGCKRVSCRTGYSPLVCLKRKIRGGIRTEWDAHTNCVMDSILQTCRHHLRPTTTLLPQLPFLRKPKPRELIQTAHR